MIPSWGAAGAAVSTCVSFWVFFILRTEFAIYVWKATPRFMLYSYSTLLVVSAIYYAFLGKYFVLEFTFLCVLILFSTLFFFKDEYGHVYTFLMKKWGN